MGRLEAYRVLGLQPGASRREVKQAYRRLAREHHPDFVQLDPDAARSAEAMMKRINTAYSVIERSCGPGRTALHREEPPDVDPADGVLVRFRWIRDFRATVFGDDLGDYAMGAFVGLIFVSGVVFSVWSTLESVSNLWWSIPYSLLVLSSIVELVRSFLPDAPSRPT